jgi:uncharacterized lipoprotein YmbA
MYKRIIGVLGLGLFWIFLSGCGGTPEQKYILSEPLELSATHKGIRGQIGVEKVVVPAYLGDTKIPIETAPGELTYSSKALWATPPEHALMSHAIRYLQKRFGSPNVLPYPWDIESTYGTRLKIVVNRFVYATRTQAVELEAGIYVSALDGSHRRARLFRTRVQADPGDTPAIVRAMNVAFDRLCDKAAHMIRRR